MFLKILSILVLYLFVASGQVLVPPVNYTNHTFYNQTNSSHFIGWHPVHPSHPFHPFHPVNPYHPLSPSRPHSHNSSNVVNKSKLSTGHIIIGTIGPTDRILYSKDFEKYGIWFTVRSKTFEYPKDISGGYSRRYETISAIHVINLNHDGILHSKAQIIAGGVGQKYVKISFVSSVGKGFRYHVWIFGH